MKYILHDNITFNSLHFIGFCQCLRLKKMISDLIRISGFRAQTTNEIRGVNPPIEVSAEYRENPTEPANDDNEEDSSSKICGTELPQSEEQEDGK